MGVINRLHPFLLKYIPQLYQPVSGFIARLLVLRGNQIATFLTGTSQFFQVLAVLI